MSTLAFAALTTRREQAAPGTSTSGAPPGVRSYVDAFAALVPAEVLSLHGVILSFTTGKKEAASLTTEIVDQGALFWAFFGLVALSVVLYAVPRFPKWDRLDYFRVAIPPVAFVGWTMLQRSTAFDAVNAVWPQMGEAKGTVVALFVGVVLGVVAAALAYKADQKKPQGS